MNTGAWIFFGLVCLMIAGFLYFWIILPIYLSAREYMSSDNAVQEDEPGSFVPVPPVPLAIEESGRFEPVPGSNGTPEPAEYLPPSLIELRQLYHAITLHNKGTGKVAAIETAFSVKKGGSKAYIRAKQLFDNAMQPGDKNNDKP